MGCFYALVATMIFLFLLFTYVGKVARKGAEVRGRALSSSPDRVHAPCEASFHLYVDKRRSDDRLFLLWKNRRPRGSYASLRRSSARSSRRSTFPVSTFSWSHCTVTCVLRPETVQRRRHLRAPHPLRCSFRLRRAPGDRELCVCVCDILRRIGRTQWTIPDERRNYLLSFPDMTCTSTGHILQGAPPPASPAMRSTLFRCAQWLTKPLPGVRAATGIIAIVAVPIWVFLGRFYVSCYITPPPMTEQLLARADRRAAPAPHARSGGPREGLRPCASFAHSPRCLPRAPPSPHPRDAASPARAAAWPSATST